jgi:hypothetical protein
MKAINKTTAAKFVSELAGAVKSMEASAGHCIELSKMITAQYGKDKPEKLGPLVVMVDFGCLSEGTKKADLSKEESKAMARVRYALELAYPAAYSRVKNQAGKRATAKTAAKNETASAPPTLTQGTAATIDAWRSFMVLMNANQIASELKRLPVSVINAIREQLQPAAKPAATKPAATKPAAKAPAKPAAKPAATKPAAKPAAKAPAK